MYISIGWIILIIVVLLCTEIGRALIATVLVLAWILFIFIGIPLAILGGMIILLGA